MASPRAFAAAISMPESAMGGGLAHPGFAGEQADPGCLQQPGEALRGRCEADRPRAVPCTHFERDPIDFPRIVLSTIALR